MKQASASAQVIKELSKEGIEYIFFDTPNPTIKSAGVIWSARMKCYIVNIDYKDGEQKMYNVKTTKQIDTLIK